MRLWILGAGFSRRLGGPLLTDLLDVTLVERLKQRHAGTWLDEPRSELVARVCCRGIEEREWRDAEEFLTLLLPRDGVDEARIWTVLEACGPIPADLSASARTTAEVELLYCQAIAVVAAQCIDFVDVVREDREAWLPYDRWVSSLPEDEVILSFNYDRVVEHAFARARRDLAVPNPRSPAGPIVAPGRPLLLKLHGSVDFRDTIPQPYEPPSLANLVTNPAFIGVPGQGKVDHADYDFPKLWKHAEAALQAADEVVVVGYRCPETDEMSKALILDGLAKNAKKPAVDVVLGPGGSHDALRMTSLLGRAGVEVRNTSLWAQDYLSAVGIGHGWTPRYDPGTDDEET